MEFKHALNDYRNIKAISPVNEKSGWRKIASESDELENGLLGLMCGLWSMVMYYVQRRKARLQALGFYVFSYCFDQLSCCLWSVDIIDTTHFWIGITCSI